MMELKQVNLSDTGYFSPLFLDYLDQKPALAPFYSYTPDLQGLKEAAEKRRFSLENRKILVDAIKKQYQDIHPPGAVGQNIENLALNDTLTVTTGHQLCLMGGPLYFIYKIATTIRLADRLQKEWPGKKVVPVFWMASEDHDFDEINHFTVFGKTHHWEKSHGGAVGQLDTAGIDELLLQINGDTEAFKNLYRESKTLAEATARLVNFLFGEYGIVVLDANDRTLKSLFSDTMKEELLERNANGLVHRSLTNLQQLGYDAPVNPREINLFYMEMGSRKRIEMMGDVFTLAGEEKSFEKAELLEILGKYPERFSPNVVLRPLYQEAILPNIAYIGGPSEIAYWLELRTLFQYYEFDFPALIPRNFVGIIGKGNVKKMDRFGYSERELFYSLAELKKCALERVGGTPPDFESERALVAQAFSSISGKMAKTDATLEPLVAALQAETFKGIDKLEKRLLKEIERKEEVLMQQVQTLKDSLFPHSGLQERTDNFLNFYWNIPNFMATLLHKLDPLDFRFNWLADR